MKLSADFIHRYKGASGGWSKAQLAVLGVSWPPSKGWIERLVGQEITDLQVEQFKAEAYVQTNLPIF